MSSERKFVGSIQEKTFDNGGMLFKLGIKAEDLKGLENERGFINLIISKKKEPKNDGKDWFCYLDEYQPEQ